MGEEGVLFKKLDKPVQFRRSLLEASRDVIKSLQKYEQSKQLRVKKMEEMARLRVIIKEINLLVAKLKKDLPEVEFKQKEKKFKVEVEGPKKENDEAKPKAKKPEIKAKKENKELNDLAKQLKDIEGKLETLY